MADVIGTTEITETEITTIDRRPRRLHRIHLRHAGTPTRSTEVAVITEPSQKFSKIAQQRERGREKNKNT